MQPLTDFILCGCVCMCTRMLIKMFEQFFCALSVLPSASERSWVACQELTDEQVGFSTHTLLQSEHLRVCTESVKSSRLYLKEAAAPFKFAAERKWTHFASLVVRSFIWFCFFASLHLINCFLLMCAITYNSHISEYALYTFEVNLIWPWLHFGMHMSSC